ncbi:MAG: hypothetical protein ACOH5I_04275 [Oligoflexus sp.]
MKVKDLSYLGLVVLLWSGSRVLAIPQNISLYCNHYPNSPKCIKNSVSCTTCHAIPPSMNPYGEDLKTALNANDEFDKSAASFARFLPDAFMQIEALDSDGDKFSNLDEIMAGSEPGQTIDTPDLPPPDGRRYEPRLALRRLKLAFCGVSPSFEEQKKLLELEDPMPWLHLLLDDCLASDYWQNVALHRLADPRIRPNESIGFDGNPFIVGDYRYDYRLFTYIMTGDRDARELLLADYHLDEQGQKTTAVIPTTLVPERIVVGNGQPLIAERRAGMITTQWFLGTNTMFAELPRNSASQAYRAYLGLDIAKSEGLFPIANEPRDVDHKGVAEPACAVCHSTLDPLAYSFAAYNGLGGGGDEGPRAVGAYNPMRTTWEADGFLFQQAVPDLNAWAELAANSDDFKKNLVMMIFEQALGKRPEGTWEESDFEELWQGIADDDYQVQKLIHRFFETKSFAGVAS